MTKKSDIHICQRPIILQQTHKIYTVTMVTRLPTLTPCKKLNSPRKKRRAFQYKRAFQHVRRALQLRRRAFRQVEEGISPKEGLSTGDRRAVRHFTRALQLGNQLTLGLSLGLGLGLAQGHFQNKYFLSTPVLKIFP